MLDPYAYWDAQGPIDPNPAPPAYVDKYRKYWRDFGSHVGDAAPPMKSDPDDLFSPGGRFVFDSATSSRPLGGAQSFGAPPAEAADNKNVRRLMRVQADVPRSVVDRVTGAPPPSELAPANPASFDDRFGNWISSPDVVGAPRVPYQGVPASPDGRPLGIVSGQPMPDYPFPPVIWGFPEETVKQGAERWAGWNPKPTTWKKTTR